MAEVDEGLIEALGALSDLLAPASDVLANMANVAMRAVPGCDHASISVLGGDGVVVTAGASDDRSLRLDELQYDADDGPCLLAIRSGATVQVDEFAREGRFPGFAPAAVAGGVSSCLSLPVIVGGKTAGGMNLYGDRVHAYNDESVRAGEEVAGQAAVVIAGARAFERSLKLVDQLRIAIGSRSEIEQAKGILMARSHCDADQAFDILRRASQRQNVKLRDIAHTIVLHTAAGTTGVSPEDQL
jgi:GAF domain-containing protein